MILQAKYNTNIILYKIVGRLFIMIVFGKIKKMSVCWRRKKKRQFGFFLVLDVYLAHNQNRMSLLEKHL